MESTPNNSDDEHIEIPPDILAEFEAASRRTLEERFRYSFIKTCRPVLDDARYRSFDTMADYRRWCEENLPSWLGFGPADKIEDADMRNNRSG